MTVPVHKQRRGTAAAMAAANETPAAGQIYFELDTNRVKIGDGVRAYNSLPYLDAKAISQIEGLQAALDTVASGLNAKVNLTDTRLTDERVPVDGSVTAIKLSDDFVLDCGEVESSYDIDARGYFERVEGPTGDNQILEEAVKTAINEFVVGCKIDGIWNSIKASCLLAGARTLSGALQPLAGAAPTNFNFVSGDYNRKTGLKGNGSTKHLDSNRDNSDDPQDSQHLSVFVTEFRTNGSTYMGAGGFASGTSTLGTGFARSRNSSSDSGFSAAQLGFVGISRGSSADYQVRADSIVTTFSRSSQTPRNGHVYAYAINNNGPTIYSDPRLAFYSIGEAIDLTALDSRLSTLMTAIGGAIA